MQPSEDRHGEGHGRPGIQQRYKDSLLVRDDRLVRRDPRTDVFSTDGSNPDRGYAKIHVKIGHFVKSN